MGKEANKAQGKNTNPSPPSLHPPYLQMITEAISSLKDRTGSSQQAIAKAVEEKYPNHLPPNFKKILSVQLKKFVKSGKLVKVKNSYKISTTENPKTGEVKKKTTDAKKAPTPQKAAKKAVEKAVKMKRLSQVKTPEALKRKSAKKSDNKVVKKDLNPAKRKASSKAQKSPKPSKKAKN